MLRWNKVNPDRTLPVNIGSPQTSEEKIILSLHYQN